MLIKMKTRICATPAGKRSILLVTSFELLIYEYYNEIVQA